MTLKVFHVTSHRPVSTRRTAKTSSFLTSWTSVCIFPYLQIFVFTFVKVPDRELISDNSSLYYCVITENKFLCMLYLLHIWIFYWMKTTKSKNQERKIPLYVFSGVNSVLHNFFEFVSSLFLWFHFFHFFFKFCIFIRHWIETDCFT